MLVAGRVFIGKFQFFREASWHYLGPDLSQIWPHIPSPICCLDNENAREVNEEIETNQH